MNKPHP